MIFSGYSCGSAGQSTGGNRQKLKLIGLFSVFSYTILVIYSRDVIRWSTPRVFLPSHNESAVARSDLFANPLDNSHICDKDTDVLILVNSRITAASNRAAIRDTWGKAIREGVWLGQALEGHVSLGFVVGISHPQVNITREKSTHQDIIQGNFVDHYRNLTRKSLFAMEWADAYCSHAKYFIKSDDDVMVNVPHIIRILNKQNLTRTIMGPFIDFARPERSTTKWKVTKEEYPGQTYPPFVAGSAYVITMDLIRPLLEASRKLPYLFIDDVYITGILAKHVHARHAVQKGFSFLNTALPTACQFIDGTRLSGHGYKHPDNMKNFWNSLAKAKC